MAEPTKFTPEDCLAGLAGLMLVDIDGLARATAPNDPTRQAELKAGETLPTFINVLFDADNSIEDVCKLIMRAAKEQSYEVDVYFQGVEGKWHHYETTTLRAPTHTAACDMGIKRLANDARIEHWRAEAKPLEDELDEESCRLRRTNKQPSTPTGRMVLTALLLVEDFDVTEQELDAWPPLLRREAADWAWAVHTQASDNDDVVVPPKPTEVSALKVRPQPWEKQDVVPATVGSPAPDQRQE